MRNYVLRSFIEQFKKGEMASFPIIYNNFKKLIFFYANRLDYEDSAAEMILFFVELLYTVRLDRFKCDASQSLEKYIAVCLRNQYFALLKKAIKHSQNFSHYYEETVPFYELYDERILLREGFKKLSEKQKTVLSNKYIYGYSDAEIAQMMGITRQAVNYIKNRAFEILQKYIEG